jgi:hypothetical protein
MSLGTLIIIIGVLIIIGPFIIYLIARLVSSAVFTSYFEERFKYSKGEHTNGIKEKEND